MAVDVAQLFGERQRLDDTVLLCFLSGHSLNAQHRALVALELLDHLLGSTAISVIKRARCAVYVTR